MNFSRLTSSGSSEARIVALEATSGRRARQTWRRLGAGNGVIGVRSRRLSIPISAIGSHRSISRVVMRFLIYRHAVTQGRVCTHLVESVQRWQDLGAILHGRML